MKLEAGEVYLRASGEIVKIIYCDSACCYDIDEVEYLHDGKYVCGYRSNDLIAHIPKELHFRLCEIIEDYHIDIDVKEFIDNNYKIHKGNK